MRICLSNKRDTYSLVLKIVTDIDMGPTIHQEECKVQNHGFLELKKKI